MGAKTWFGSLFSGDEERVSFLIVIAGCFCGLALYLYWRYGDISANLNELLKWLLGLVTGNNVVAATKGAIANKATAAVEAVQAAASPLTATTAKTEGRIPQ
jgi:hypothetical protein